MIDFTQMIGDNVVKFIHTGLMVLVIDTNGYNVV